MRPTWEVRRISLIRPHKMKYLLNRHEKIAVVMLAVVDPDRMSILSQQLWWSHSALLIEVKRARWRALGRTMDDMTSHFTVVLFCPQWPYDHLTDRNKENDVCSSSGIGVLMKGLSENERRRNRLVFNRKWSLHTMLHTPILPLPQPG